MAQWEALIGSSTFWGSTITPLAAVAGAMENVITPVQTILTILQSVLNIIRVFIVDLSNVLLALATTLVAQIESFLNQLANSGLYILVVGPTSVASVAAFLNSISGGFDGFINKVVNSFSDVSDPQRPVFPATQPCAGIVVGISSGTVQNAMSFLSLFSKTMAGLFRSLAVPPTIKGFPGNEASIIYFSKPQIPTSLFGSVKYQLQRSTSPGGIPVLAPVATSVANASITSTMEPVRNNSTGRVQTTYETVGPPLTTSLLTATDFIFVDGEDTVSPQLVKFDLSVQANTKAFLSGTNVITNNNPLGTSFSGPSKFTLRSSLIANFGPAATNLFSGVVTSNYIDITETLENLSSAVLSKVNSYFVGDTPNPDLDATYYLEVRINGSPLADSASLATTGGYYVVSFDGDTFQLNQPVPLGSKVEVYTYLQAKAGDVVRYQQLSKYHPGTYTSVYYFGPEAAETASANLATAQANADAALAASNANRNPNTEAAYFAASDALLAAQQQVTAANASYPASGIPVNGTPYYYNIQVLDSNGQPLNPVVTSNEIRIVPQIAISPNPPPAYCIGLNTGPFTFTQDNNWLNFSIGLNTFDVRIRPSIKNVFAVSPSSATTTTQGTTTSTDINTGGNVFQNSFGLILDPRVSANVNTPSLSASSTTTSGVNGLLLNFTSFDGSKQVVQPGALIPVDIEDVLSDLNAQCHNKSVTFAIKKGRLVIQDTSAAGKLGNSQIVIGNGTANAVLGFTPGFCSSRSLSSRLHWERLAMKDILPFINDLAEIIESVANSLLRSTESGVQSILDFITLIQTKISTIQSYLTEIQNLLTIIQNFTVNLPNLYILKLPVVNGSAALVQAIQTATNVPPNSPTDYAMGVCIVVGGVGVPVAQISGLLNTLL